MDILLKENFDLKREIVFERKRYVDLQNAYQDLRNDGIDESAEKRSGTLGPENQIRMSVPINNINNNPRFSA
jgi:hypothetical protein